jgi:hypothetical protein
MPQRRHTITVASSALFFVCLMFHAQTRLYSQTSIPGNDAESYSVYESLLPTDWTVAVAHARRLLLQTQIGTSGLRLKSGIESSAFLQLFKSHNTGWKTPAERASSTGSRITLYSVTGIFYTRDSKDGIWTNLRWQATSRAWAS